jgi:hypothetical protein
MANYAKNMGCKSKGGPNQKSDGDEKGKKKLPPFLEYKDGKVVKKKK